MEIAVIDKKLVFLIFAFSKDFEVKLLSLTVDPLIYTTVGRNQLEQHNLAKWQKSN